MRKSLAVGVLLAISATVLPANAQKAPSEFELSRLELYGGYDYLRFNANPRISGVPLSQSFNANGVSGQIEYNAGHCLVLVADSLGSF